MIRTVLDRRDLLAAATAATCIAGTAVAEDAPGTPGTYQLRIYEIYEANKAAFHARFRDHAARIMARHGFEIVAMWEAHGERGPTFVYLLRWPDAAVMAARWAAFMADAEWSRIKDETAARHGRLVGRIESRTMDLVPYSPRLAS